MLIQRWLPAVMMLPMLLACDFLEHRHYHDPHLKLNASDYQAITQPVSSPSPVPPFQPVFQAEASYPKLTLSMKTAVTLTVTEGVPLHEVFRELTRQSGVGLALDPQIQTLQGGVIYAAQDQPLIQVIEDLCQLTGSRFQIRGNLVHIEQDTPYLQTYQVDFLNNRRSSENRMSISTDVFTVMENGKNRADNGSNSLLSAESSSDFWEELEGNLQMILYEGGMNEKAAPFTLNKQAGLVVAQGTAQQHARIGEFLTKLKESVGTQVLIEAKIIEVNLDDEYRSGINWSYLGKTLQASSAMGGLSSPGPLNVSTGLKRDVFTLAVDSSDFASVLNLVKTFGSVRTLSNPRMTVMNNQPAMLKVATNEVFFQLEFDRYFQADGKPDVESFSSHVMTVPIGLVLVVQPAVNSCTGEITMTLRPTVSRIEKFVEDPAVAIKSNQKVSSRIPVVQVREIDSVLRIKSGEVLILGGLMEDQSRHGSSSIPMVDQIPLLGELVRGKDDERKMTELVIFLTATIVQESLVAGADVRFYNTYVEDPRALDF